MEKRALKRGFGWFIVLVLPLVLILGVVPCAAEETYNLQELITNQTTIPVDNLTFSGFKLNGDPFAYPGDPIIPPQAADITVEVVGRGTTSPGLKFIPNFQVAVEPGSIDDNFFLKTISFSYQASDGSDLIKGRALILHPGTVEATGEYAKAMVEDRGAPFDSTDYYLTVVRDAHESDSSGEYLVADTLQQEITFTKQPTVSPSITVALSVSSPGGEASIDSFEQRFTLAAASEAPIADAGPDQAVLDQVSLDGSNSSPPEAEYQWELYQEGEDGWELFASASGVQVEFTNLVYGIYEARLTVTSSGVSAVDTALIAAAGQSGGGTEPGITETELNLWDFTLKKYKYCKWSTARMVGTFNLPDDLEFHRGDDLVGKVTIQLNSGEEPLVLMSDDIKVRVSNWGYKLQISSH